MQIEEEIKKCVCGGDGVRVKESKKVNASCTSEKKRMTEEIQAAQAPYGIFPHLTVSRRFLVTLLILCVVNTAD